MEVNAKIKSSSSNISSESNYKNENLANDQNADYFVKQSNREIKNQSADTEDEKLPTENNTQLELRKKNSVSELNRITDLSREASIKNEIELREPRNKLYNPTRNKMSDSQNQIKTISQKINYEMPPVMTGVNYDVVNLTGCEESHIGTRIHASHVTIVNNNYDDKASQKQELKIHKKKCKHGCHNPKLKLLLLTFLIIFLLLVLEMINSLVFTDPILKEEINHMPETGKNTTQKESILPETLYISRDKWDVNSSISTLYRCPIIKSKVRSVLLSQTNSECCSNTDSCSVILQDVNQEHKRNLSVYSGDINYNFMIDDDGRIYEGRGWNFSVDTFHPYAGTFIVIAFIGDYLCEGRNLLPTAMQNEGLIKLLEIGVTLGNLYKDFVVVPRCCLDNKYVKQGDGARIVKLLKGYPHLSMSECYFKFKCSTHCHQDRLDELLSIKRKVT